MVAAKRTQSKILIVGNSDGIGAALTRQLVDRGDRIVGISRSASPLGPAGPRHKVCDVTDPRMVELVSRLDDEEDGFDACCYCAGIGSGLTLPDLSKEARVFDVNLLGAVRVLEALVPRWLARPRDPGARRGHFIGLSSLTDELLVKDAPSYSASKAGLTNYLGSMGLTLRPHGIAVTNVRFGFVDTKMARSPLRPLMMTRERAAAHIVGCLDRRPLQFSAPKTIAALVQLLRLGQSLRL